MHDLRPKVLIAEDQIFIAMEAERIFTETVDCLVDICRRDQIAAFISSKRYDLVVLEFAGNHAEDRRLAAIAVSTGAAFSFLCSLDYLPEARSILPGASWIEKPFNEAEFKAFVDTFASRRTGK